jgi:hypothetical protein
MMLKLLLITLPPDMMFWLSNNKVPEADDFKVFGLTYWGYDLYSICCFTRLFSSYAGWLD